MGSSIKIRIILDIFIIISIGILPYWFSLLLIALGLSIFFNSFYEAFIFAVMIDSLYGVPVEIFFNLHFITFIIVVVLFFCINWFKKMLRI